MIAQKQKGFTLMELLVVVAIIGVMMGLAMVSYSNSRQQARDAKRVSDMRQIQLALDLYFNTNGNYPNLLASISATSDNNWTSGLGAALSPYMPTMPRETSFGEYRYSATNDGRKYGLMTTLENDSDTVNNDGGYYNNGQNYYEVGPSPKDCAAAAMDWWGNTAINCP